MVLGMNIFTAFFVLLLLLSKNVPSATDAIPLIGAYYCLNMVMIATSTVCCTVVVHIFFRGQDQVPWILRKIFLEFLARIFCMRKPPVLPAPQPARNPNNQKPAQPATIVTSLNNPTNQLSHQVNLPASTAHLNPKQPNSLSTNSLNLNSNEEPVNSSLTNQQYQQLLQQQPLLSKQIENAQESNINMNTNKNLLQHRSSSYFQPNSNQHFHTHQQSSQLNTDLSLSFNLIENDIKEIRDYLRHTRKKLENNDSKSKQTNEWKQIALVLDRSLFFLYLIAIFVSLAIMFNKL